MEIINPYISQKITVPLGFEEVFTHFYLAKNTGNQAINKIFLPSFQTIMIFNLGTKGSFSTKQQTNIEIEQCLLLGLIKQAIEYVLPAGAEILVANFKADEYPRQISTRISSNRNGQSTRTYFRQRNLYLLRIGNYRTFLF